MSGSKAEVEGKPAWPSLTNLAATDTWTGDLLRKVHRRAIQEADRHDDPWALLLSLHDVPTTLRALFEAGKSQLQALRRLAQIARGSGTVHSSAYDELLAAVCSSNAKGLTQAAERLLRGGYNYDGCRWYLEHATAPSVRARIEVFVQRTYERDVQRLGRRRADERLAGHKPATFIEGSDAEGDYIADALTQGWLWNPEGIPGYCYMTDEVLAHVLGDVLKLPGLTSKERQAWLTVRTVRKRMKLKHGPIVIHKARKQDGRWELFRRSGELVWPKRSPG